MSNFELPLVEASEGAVKLRPRLIHKPWGKSDLPWMFEPATNGRVGEVWFEQARGEDLPLMVKYIFTSEPVSVQVHPNDAQARSKGLQRGKMECWYVLDAEPGATIAYGLKGTHSKEEVRSAALDGTIEELLDWKPVQPGDFFYVPGGTIHAIGAGVSLLELQQNAWVTYRLYDYGRERSLQLEDALSVAECGPSPLAIRKTATDPANTVLITSPDLSLVRATHADSVPPELKERRRWVLPLRGIATAGYTSARVGECLFLRARESLQLSSDAVVLIAAEGPIRQTAI